MKKKKIGIVDFMQLQGAVIVYSLSTVAANIASKMLKEFGLFSWQFILAFFVVFAILGTYAIIWQQMIKKFQLSVAYGNKAMTLLWSMLWNFVIFSNGIKPFQVVGVFLVVVGVIVMNSGEVEGKVND